MRVSSTDSPAWIVTDGEGRIEVLSRAAATLLGVGAAADSRSLLHFFPGHQRALAVDMEVALTGWPSVRTVVLAPRASRPVTVRYLVSRHLTGNSVELHWTLDLVDRGFAAAS